MLKKTMQILSDGASTRQHDSKVQTQGLVEGMIRSKAENAPQKK